MRKYSFKPRLIPIIAFLLLLPILLALGFWQLQRAEQKRQIETDYASRSKATPLTINSLNTLTAKPAHWRYYPVILSGKFDAKHNILLDNKFHQHQIGYQVITPFILNNGKAVLINRGWIPLGATRDKLPVISTSVQKQTLRGTLTIPDPKSFVLNNRPDNNEQWPLRIEQIDIPLLIKATGHELYPIIILLTPNQADGFARDWQPVTMKAYVHTGYAFQWFTMAAALIIIFIAVNLKRRNSL